jgi:putative glutamine amidotransferase
MSRPLIGVTTSRRGGWRSYLMHRLALRRAGAKAMRIVSGDAVACEDLDGLVIGGGDDIGAELYGGQVLPDVRIDPERDKLELKLLEWALPQGLPILGICRGSQMINVALGGTLHTDIHAVYVEAPRMRTVLPKKTVHIAEGSRLDCILACNPCRVNALHHQSVDRVGRGLEIGIVQATEGTGPNFLIGVQWHPELLVFRKPQQRIFAALAEAAREAKRHDYAPAQASAA